MGNGCGDNPSVIGKGHGADGGKPAGRLQLGRRSLGDSPEGIAKGQTQHGDDDQGNQFEKRGDILHSAARFWRESI